MGKKDTYKVYCDFRTLKNPSKLNANNNKNTGDRVNSHVGAIT